MVIDLLHELPEKEFHPRERSVRTTRGKVEPKIWLRNQYTNDEGQMICQICKGVMPFRGRDGEHYFEAVEALSKKYLCKEYEAQFLGLCPECAARYREFVKHDDEAMAEFKSALIHSDSCEVAIGLGEMDASIRFVETHFLDFKTILEESE